MRSHHHHQASSGRSTHTQIDQRHQVAQRTKTDNQEPCLFRLPVFCFFSIMCATPRRSAPHRTAPHRTAPHLNDEPVAGLLSLQPAEPSDLFQLLSEVLPNNELLVLNGRIDQGRKQDMMSKYGRRSRFAAEAVTQEPTPPPLTHNPWF